MLQQHRGTAGSPRRLGAVAATAVAFALVLTAAAPGCATILSDCPIAAVGPAGTLDQLMSLSSEVVIGTVLSTHKGRHTNPSGAPITARIHVDRVVRGSHSIEGHEIAVLDDWSGGCGEVGREHQPVRRWSPSERVFLFLVRPERGSGSAGGALYDTATVSGRYTIGTGGRLAAESLVSAVDDPLSASLPGKYTEPELEKAVEQLPLGRR